MELKVWVDGIQRVVCGVTETSTCQDVVYALAHATGQTGRFTLVEKWRNNERLLAPQEHPLKVLTKWGEYANDVHFIMRRSSSDSKVQSSGNNQMQNNKRQHDFLRSFSPPGSNNQKVQVNNKEIKKSLTFSCGHGSSGSTSSESSTPTILSDNHSKSETSTSSTNRNIKNLENRSKQDLPKGVVRGVPQRPRDSESPNGMKIERPKHPPSYDEAVSRSSGRFPASHLSLATPASSSNSREEESPSSKRRHLAARENLPSSEKSNSLINNSHTNAKQPNNHKIHISSDQPREHRVRSPELTNCTDRVSISPSRAKSPSRSPEKTLLLHNNNPSDTSKSKIPVLSTNIQNEKHLITENKQSMVSSKGSSVQSEDSNRDPQYQDLLRLVALQREKLDNQQAELTQFDAEIIYWESKLQEQEEKLSLLQEEMCHLERTQHEQEGELIQLDRRSFTEEVELGRQEERTLRSELTLARSQLANCETELLQCRQRIRLLLEEIAEERRLKNLREEQEKKDHEEQEKHIQSQIESIQQQLNDRLAESENQTTATEQAKEELHELETKLMDKQKEMEKLMEEIREANLRSLSLIPADEGKFITEGNFHNRPGSTRKIIGSPRQLENAFPTNKNPHGVWV